MINHITVTITEEFIEYRNEYAHKFNDYDRTVEQKIEDSDGLLPEFLLLKKGKVSPPLKKEHDYIISKMKIDNKMIGLNASTVTIANRKIDWMKAAVENGDLTHFSITRWISKPIGRALEVGNSVTFEYVKLMDAREALRSLRLSKLYKNCSYFWVN